MALSFPWLAIALGAIRYRLAFRGFKLAAGTFAVAAATLAIVTYSQLKQDSAAIDSVRNETILYRHEEASYRRTDE